MVYERFTIIITPAARFPQVNMGPMGKNDFGASVVVVTLLYKLVGRDSGARDRDGFM